MEDFLVLVFWAVIIVGSIVSSAAKAKKKREEEARRAVAAGHTTAAGEAAGGDTPSPWPFAIPQSPQVWQAEDYHSLEMEYDAMDGHGRRDTPVVVSTEAARPASCTTDPIVEPAAIADEGAITNLRELLGGDFDLRRAVIEAEILNPKYR